MTQQIGIEEGSFQRVSNAEDIEYAAYMDRIQRRLAANTADSRLFTTDANLWEMYLGGFADPAERQYHNCNTCRKFIESFGGLAVIYADGRTKSAIWDEADAPATYAASVASMVRAVRRARITGVFITESPALGTDQAGGWSHFHATLDTTHVHRHPTLTAGQAMSEKREDFKNVLRAVSEYKLASIETAVAVLNGDALYRAEKILGQAEWLRDTAIAWARPITGGANLVWRAVASAPAGFCHPRGGVLGALIDDIDSGYSFAVVAERFAKKMHPLQYQRPQAAPTAGAIANAEKLIEKLGIAESLKRRYARFDEVSAIWRPREAVVTLDGKGVFGHLQPKGETQGPTIKSPPRVVTWGKFWTEMLAARWERVEVHAPNNGNYAVLVTAENPDAPPILQWDMPDDRNPVSWYIWVGGSTAQQFGLRAGSWCEVSAIAHKPSAWGRRPGAVTIGAHHGDGVMFIIRGAADTRVGAGGALFPEILKSELREVRSVIEAYSKSATLSGAAEQSASGLLLEKGPWHLGVRTWTGGRSTDYVIDRME
jgi:hypothetical protein